MSYFFGIDDDINLLDLVIGVRKSHDKYGRSFLSWMLIPRYLAFDIFFSRQGRARGGLFIQVANQSWLAVNKRRAYGCLDLLEELLLQSNHIASHPLGTGQGFESRVDFASAIGVEHNFICEQEQQPFHIAVHAHLDKLCEDLLLLRLGYLCEAAERG
jgi:hypothetical protein